MARDNLELSAWGDGTIRLSFWDSDHGLDQIYILGDDGQAYTEDEKDERTPVDLIAALRALVEKWSTQ